MDAKLNAWPYPGAKGMQRANPPGNGHFQSLAESVQALHPLNRLDALVDEARIAISLLQERRTALISAAVTGKIDAQCNGSSLT